MKWNDKKSTPDEQTLIEYLLSDEAKAYLLTLVDIPVPPRKYIEKIAFCEGGEKCSVTRAAHRENPPRHCKTCKNYTGDPRSYAAKPTSTFKEVDLVITSEETSWKYRLESICKTRGRIIGYIDLIQRYDITSSYEAKLDDNWIWSNFRTDVVKHAFIIEAKPKIKVFQQVLRQIKTYKHFIFYDDDYSIPLLRNADETYYVVATYEDLSSTIISAFENENILVMHIDPPIEGQQRLG